MNPNLTEAAYQRRILDLAAWLKLRAFHSTDARRDSCAGWPDLALCGPGGFALLEVKTATGRVRPEQRGWLDALTVAGVDARIVRPGDWPEVEATLRRLAGRL